MTDGSVDGTFVAGVLSAAAEANSATDPVMQHIDVAGIRMDLHYAGPVLHEQFSPALAHLEVFPDPDGDPVVIRLWDSQSTGVPAPPPPVPRDRFTDRGDLLGLDAPGFRTAFHWSEYSVCVLDVARGLAAYWVDDPGNLPYWSRSSPLRTVFGWLLADRGVQLLHAAAVATDDGAVVVVGGGGRGKSTTALTCLERGLEFLGDDYIAVSFDPPTVHSLYATAKIADAGHPAARQIPAMPASMDDEKLVLRLHPKRAAQMRRSALLRAVVTPEIVDRSTSDIVQVDRARLEHAATFTTLAQLPHAGANARARIGRLLDEVPCGLLRLGSDRDGVVDAIRRLAADPTIVSPATTIGDGEDLPSVTVVVPVHNGAHFLADAIDSILSQQYPKLEIVVIDDGSEDDLLGALAALPVDVRVHHQPCAGPAAARNAGIALATSDLIAFLDVDDLWSHGMLLTLVREWAVGGADVVIGRAQVVEIDPTTAVELPVGTPDTAFPHYIGSAVYDRRVFDRVGTFDAQMMFGEDTDWFTRLAESGTALRRLSAVTLVVRRHGQNMTEGRDLVELHVVRAVKKALDRKRDREHTP